MNPVPKTLTHPPKVAPLLVAFTLDKVALEPVITDITIECELMAGFGGIVVIITCECISHRELLASLFHRYYTPENHETSDLFDLATARFC